MKKFSAFQYTITIFVFIVWALVVSKFTERRTTNRIEESLQGLSVFIKWVIDENDFLIETLDQCNARLRFNGIKPLVIDRDK